MVFLVFSYKVPNYWILDGPLKGLHANFTKFDHKLYWDHGIDLIYWSWPRNLSLGRTIKKNKNSFKLGRVKYPVHTFKQKRMPPGSAPLECPYISLLSRTRLPTRRSTSFPPLRTFQKSSQSPRHTGRRDREGLIDMRTACSVILARLAHAAKLIKQRVWISCNRNILRLLNCNGCNFFQAWQTLGGS